VIWLWPAIWAGVIVLWLPLYWWLVVREPAPRPGAHTGQRLAGPAPQIRQHLADSETWRGLMSAPVVTR
jgi:hypothetical protein